MSKAKVQEELATIEHQLFFKVLTDIVWALAWQGLPYRGDGNKERSGNFHQVISLVSR